MQLRRLLDRRDGVCFDDLRFRQYARNRFPQGSAKQRVIVGDDQRCR
jgi:hypothetical protein